MRSRKIEEERIPIDSNARKDHQTESKSSYGTIEEQSLYSSKEDSSNGDIDKEVLECRQEERGLEPSDQRESEQCKEESEEDSDDDSEEEPDDGSEEEPEEDSEDEYEAYRRSEHVTIGTQMVSETTASNITVDVSPLPSEDGTLEEGSYGTLDLPHFNDLKGKPQGQDVVLDTPFASSITEMSLIFAEVIDWKRRKIAERLQSHEVGHTCNSECQA